MNQRHKNLKYPSTSKLYPSPTSEEGTQINNETCSVLFKIIL